MRIIKQTAESVAEEFKISVEVNIVQGYPVLKNSERLAEKAARLSRELPGDENVELFELRMSSEDFAFFTEAFPSLYFRVGIKRKGEREKGRKGEREKGRKNENAPYTFI